MMGFIRLLPQLSVSLTTKQDANKIISRKDDANICISNEKKYKKVYNCTDDESSYPTANIKKELCLARIDAKVLLRRTTAATVCCMRQAVQ